MKMQRWLERWERNQVLVMLGMTVWGGGAPERKVWWQGKVKNYGCEGHGRRGRGL